MLYLRARDVEGYLAYTAGYPKNPASNHLYTLLSTPTKLFTFLDEDGDFAFYIDLSEQGGTEETLLFADELADLDIIAYITRKPRSSP